MPKILVADDDEILCGVVAFTLEGDGHEVACVDNGAAALERVRGESFDVLILDSMMPALSGMEVLASIKSDPAIAGLPVVMLTARHSHDDVVGALRAGAAEYVTKPFIPEELSVRVTSALARAGLDAAGARS
jgi:DNA-binding response OmpR family regulator